MSLSVEGFFIVVCGVLGLSLLTAISSIFVIEGEKVPSIIYLMSIVVPLFVGPSAAKDFRKCVAWSMAITCFTGGIGGVWLMKHHGFYFLDLAACYLT